MEQELLIVGGGPAGYTAALYGARAGLSVLLLEKLSPGGQMGTTDRVDNYPGFPEGVNGFDLAMKMKEQAERFGAKTLPGEAVSVELSAEKKIVRTAAESIEARALIIAAGAEPRALGLPGEEALRGRGLSYCATCDGMFYRGKTVAVVGGGNTAVSDALYLSRLCGKVVLIHRRDRLRASRVTTDPLKQAGNVEILWNTRVVEFLHGERLSGLRLENAEGETRELSCEGLFVAVGREPATALYRGQLRLDEAGYILADETTRTGVPGVFAAGDVRSKALRQIVTAAADGAVAAHFAEEYLHG